MSHVHFNQRVNTEDRIHCLFQWTVRYALFVLAGGLSLSMGNAQAQVYLWTGASNNNWATNTNWSPNYNWNIPQPWMPATGIAQFGSEGAQTTINQNLSGLRVARLEYTADAISRTITGQTITIQAQAGSPHLLSNSSATQTITSNIHLHPQNNAPLLQINNGMVDLQGVLSTEWHSAVTKKGDGILRLAGNNTFQGPLIVEEGTVIAAHNNALGSSAHNNIVRNGASLVLENNITLNQGSIEIYGNGYNGQGVLRSSSGNNTLNSSIVVQSASRITADAGSVLHHTGSLDMKNDVEIAGSGLVHFSGQMFGSGVLTKTGDGTLRLSGNSGLNIRRLDVLEGMLELDRNVNTESGQPLNIGTNSGPAATVKLLSSNRLRHDLTVTIYQSGLLDLNGFNERAAALKMYGGTVNTNGGVLTLANAGGDVIVAHASTQTAVVNGTINLNQDNLQLIGIHVEDGSQAVDLRINGAITKSTAGTALVRKTGAGTLEYTGDQANTYVGITQVNEGTLLLNKNSPGIDAIAAGSTIEINGGTLMLGNSHQIADNVAIKMNGGKFVTGGHSDVVGTLTLTDNSTLDLGNGASVINFANSASQTWTAGKILVIENWSGSTSGGGTDQVIFGNNNTSLTQAQLGQIVFYNPQGLAPGYYAAIMLANGEIVPIPEPSTWLAGGLLLSLLVWFERKHLASWFSKLK